MKVYEGTDLRNVALVGHLHSGKTSLAAAMLYTAGATNRLTRVDEGNTLTDFDEEEVARKISITAGIAPVEWKRRKVNLVDTPGFNAFLYETKASLAAVDSAVIVVDGVAGVEVGTEHVFQLCANQDLPRAFVVNKLDRERSSFDRALESIHGAFGRSAVPVQLPIGSEKNFVGVVDLVRMRAWLYNSDGDGKGTEQEIPPAMQSEAEAAHEALVELVAEGNDELLEEFFAEGTLPVEHIVDGLRQAIREQRLFPVYCCAALHNIGAGQLMDHIVELFPNPVENQTIVGSWNGQEVTRRACDNDPASVYVFKTSADPFAGRLSFFRVISGVVKNDCHLLNASTGTDERLAHLSCPQGKTLLPVTELRAGDIGAVAKLKDTLTGHTLYDKAAPVQYPPVQLPEPSIAYAISAKSRNDEDKLGQTIQRIMEEDLCLRFSRDTQTKDFLLQGTGQAHIETVVSKLKRRYHLDVTLQAPKIPYRETIRGQASAQGRHKKQTGGHGQFGDCWIRMEPLERGDGFRFANEVFGGSIPRNFIPAVEKGIVETAANGFLAGYPMVDFKVTVYDGSYHDVDSSEMAFKLAARKAFKAAMLAAKPTLLEPVMRVQIQAPVEFAGDLMSDVTGRRGRMNGMETKGGAQIIRASIPMSEMLTYQNDLTAKTQGRGSFAMEFDHYDFVPAAQADKIIAAAKAAGVHTTDEDDS
ncbi:MAG TPA: elongation factor G [Bryobacteraceae bacterium]|nr:elongation factor G [Bryobacteraceae bacterium]